jgi:MFS family permease
MYSAAFANLLQAVVYFIPGIYLPSYAADIDIPPIQSTLVVSLLNLALIFGQVGIGALSDKTGPIVPPIMSSVIGAASVAVLWGLSKNFALLSVFSLVYGASAGGFSALWIKFAMEVTSDSYTQLAIWGFFCFER